MKIDYKKVAETLRDAEPFYPNYPEHFDAAIALCELAAKLPQGEAKRVLEDQLRGDLFTRAQVDSGMNFAFAQGIAEGREQVRLSDD